MMQATTYNNRHGDWLFVPAWILCTAAGGALGNAIAGLVPTLLLLTLPTLSSIIVGIAQGWVVPRLGINARRWLLVTALASILGWVVGSIALVAGSGILSALDLMVTGMSSASVAARSATMGLMGGMLAGAIVGYAQRSLLPIAPRHRPGWIITSAIGWAVGSAIQFACIGLWAAEAPFPALTGATMLPLPIFLALAGACGWLITGAVTGGVLHWLVWIDRHHFKPVER
jgi:hypothetical protein